MTVVGVDGCAAGWLAAWESAGSIETAVYSTIDALWDAHKDADRMLIDIPIGLPEAGARACDREARSLLGVRGTSVFPTPIRPVIEGARDGSLTYDDANALSRDRTGKGLQKQAWNIAPKIAAVDTFLVNTPDARSVVAESHPELCFTALNDWFPVALSKANDRGRNARLYILTEYITNVRGAYRETIERTLRKDVSRDDVVDALCLLAAAKQPIATVPTEPPTDTRALPMQIVHPDTAVPWDEPR